MMSVEEDQTNKAERQKKGEFVRGVSTARNWISNEPNARFKPERGRYHIYAANNCPWCHRVILARAILGLQQVISMDVIYFKRDAERGWQFRPELDAACTADTVNGKQYVTEIYALSNLKQKSVPLLWDKKLKCVVSNESAEIIRMFATQFSVLQALPTPLDLYPSILRTQIDELNAWIYTSINNGAYKAGFSSDQAIYEQAFDAYFAALDRLEQILARQRYLCSNMQPTEADIRLFPTIFRHDCVYYVRMKLNKALLCYEYPNVYGWMKDMYQYANVKEACNLRHCKNGYFGRTGNNVIPRGPDYDWDSPHNRGKIKFEPLATDNVLLGVAVPSTIGRENSAQTLNIAIKGLALASLAYFMWKAKK